MKLKQDIRIDYLIWGLVISLFLISLILLLSYLLYSTSFVVVYDVASIEPDGAVDVPAVEITPELKISVQFPLFILGLVLCLAFYIYNKKFFLIPESKRWSSAYQKLTHLVKTRIHLLSVLCVGFTLAVFVWAYGLVSKGILMNHDYPFYHLLTWYTVNYSIPLFKSVLAWNPYFYAGFPMMYFYNPGMVLFVSLANKLSLGLIPIGLGYRLFIVATLLLMPLSAYFMSRKFGFSKFDSSIITLLLIIPTSHYLLLVNFAMVSLLAATALSAVIFGLFHAYFSQKRPHYLLIASIVLAFTILLHFIVSFAISMGLLLYVFLLKDESFRRRIFALLILFVFSASMTAFWVLPSSYYYLAGYGKSNIHVISLWVITSFQGLLDYVLTIILSIPLPLWFFIAFGYLGLRGTKSELINQKFILLYPLLLLVFMFLGASPYSPIQDLQLMHLQSYVGYYLVLVAGYSLTRFYKISTLNRNTAALVVIIALLLPNISMIIYRSVFNSGEPALETALPKDVEDVFNFIKVNSNDKTRVLLEDYRYHVNYDNQMDWGPGYTTALAPLYVGKNVKFIGGFMPYGNHFKNEEIPNARGGTFFNVPLEDMTQEHFVKRMNEFNIEYLAVWSSISKSYLNASGEFVLMENYGNFSIYRYENVPESYIVAIRGDAYAEVIEFGVKDIVLKVTANETSNITISSSYFPNWHAYVDGVEVPVSEDDIFVQVTVPKSKDKTVRLTFEQGLPEKAGVLISIVAWIIILTSLIFKPRFNITKIFSRW